MERFAEIGKQHEPSPAIAGRGRAASASTSSLPLALELQQLAGNQAVQQLLRSGYIQAKLAISNPDDPEELEAENVASAIMRKAAGVPCSCSPGEEMCEECQQKQSQPTITGSSSTALFRCRSYGSKAMAKRWRKATIRRGVRRTGGWRYGGQNTAQ